MAYASSTDLTARYDERDIADLASDSGTPESDLANSAIVQAALDDASGDVDAALLKGGRYTATQLSGLTGNSLAKLKRITCEIAMHYLMERRPDFSPERAEQLEIRRKRHLERLRKGEDVFGLDPAIEAGAPSHQELTTADYQNLNFTRDHVQHYYPDRRIPNL